MRLVQDLAEQTRRFEASHVLKEVDHSTEGEEIMERVSHLLVSKPFSVRSPKSWGAEIRTFYRRTAVDRRV
jgi:hypothetical protein